MKALLLILAAFISAGAQITTYDLYIGSPKTKLFYSYRCDEAKLMLSIGHTLEFGSPEAAEKAGYAAGECTLSQPHKKAEALFDKVYSNREGSPPYTDTPTDSPYDSFASGAGDCSGKVVGITDGDTVTILNENNEQMTVRLAAIDAPEKGQAFGQAAKAHLSDLIFGQQVSGTTEKKDGYGRSICKLKRAGLDVGLSMIQDCLAWHYKKYANEQSPSDRQAYAAAQTTAEGRRCGLWKDANPRSPAEFRASFSPDDFTPSTSGRSSGTVKGGGPVRVRTYTRRDGTGVRSHTRSRPN